MGKKEEQPEALMIKQQNDKTIKQQNNDGEVRDRKGGGEGISKGVQVRDKENEDGVEI